eukprot:4970954-Amphidinium_carterae.1
MEQAKAIAKAKNASQDTGWASNLLDAVVRAKVAMKATGEAIHEVNLHFHGPKPTMKPPPTVTPKRPPPPFFESPYRSEDDESTGLHVMSPEEPRYQDGTTPRGRMVMSPSTPDRAAVLSAAAKEAAA